LEFCNGRAGLEKNYNDPYNSVKECGDIFIRLDTVIGQTDRQTDRIGKTISRSACICMLKICCVSVGMRNQYTDDVDEECYFVLCRSTDLWLDKRRVKMFISK